jgi:hypothetical protein
MLSKQIVHLSPPQIFTMQKLNVPADTCFSALPLKEFDSLKFGVYFLDYQWNYLYVNEYVQRNLGNRGESLVGKNMWSSFSELAHDTSFIKLKTDTEKGLAVNITTTSPISGQRLNIIGYPLKDCYFFCASQLPKKDELMSELRSVMDKGH